MAKPQESVVELHNVSKTIGGRPIIRNLSFSVNRGEVYGFLGPNGSGKTTTIRMMVGLISITNGDIYIEGHNIKTERSEAMAHVGAIVENPELYGYMSGMKNLIHFARMSSEPISKARMDEIVELVDLTDAIRDKVKNLLAGHETEAGHRSSAASQAFDSHTGRAYERPGSRGNPQAEGPSPLSRQKKENIAVVVSSHLLSEVELMCDRVLIIQNGQLVDEISITGPAPTTLARPVEFEVDDSKRALQLLKERDASGEDVPSFEAMQPAAEGDMLVVSLEKKNRFPLCCGCF